MKYLLQICCVVILCYSEVNACSVNWSNWVSWSGCSKTCGPDGTMSRGRRRLVGSRCVTETDVTGCNRRCLNDGQLSGGTCVCSYDYYGYCCTYGSCTWRDSTFCYPGDCPGAPSSCTCISEFGGANCMTIEAKPNIDQCTATFRKYPSSLYEPVKVDCRTAMTSYCRIRAETLEVNWVTSFIPQLNVTDTPYYVNETGFGITVAIIDWSLVRGTDVIVSGRSPCLDSDVLSIPPDQLPRRTCSNKITIGERIEHEDRLSFSVIAKNGGYLKKYNYAVPGSVTIDSPIQYTPKMYHETTLVYFDLSPPTHCSSNGNACTPGEILVIDNAFITTVQITVVWYPSDWSDNSYGGLQYFRCDVYRMTAGIDGRLDMNSDRPVTRSGNLPTSSSSTTLILPGNGLYSLVLSVIDVAGNRARVRRFVMVDTGNSIETDVTKPITAVQAAYRSGFNWLPVSEGQVTITWGGHFANPFHRDNKLLNEIKPFNETIASDFDDVTGQRSRDVIPNADGIVKFELGVSEATSTPPLEWTTIVAPRVEGDITIPDGVGSTFTVWLKAYDVMNYVIQDSSDFHIDMTPPTVINTIVFNAFGEPVNPDRVVVDFETNVLKVEARDDESGLSEIRWELVDGDNVVGKGMLPIEERDEGCEQCYCLQSMSRVVCFDLEHNITADSIQELLIEPNIVVHCDMTVIVVNNAMEESHQQMQVRVMKSDPAVGASRGDPDSSIGGIAGGVVVVVTILAVVIVVLLLWRTGKINCSRRNSPPPPIDKEWKNMASNEHGGMVGYKNNGYVYEDTAVVEVNTKVKHTAPPPRPPKNGNAYVDTKVKSIVQSSLSMDEMEFPADQLELVELLKSGIYKANATDIGGSRGLTIVAVKTLKDQDSSLQREALLHELDIMLKIIPHDNIIRLLGCMVEYGSPKPSIIMEYACYDTLSTVLRQSRQTAANNEPTYDNWSGGGNTLTSTQLMRFAEQIASGMEHLGQLNIIHRKLAARNIFVGEHETCKIGSFAMSVQTHEQEIKDSRETRLPIRWMATESLRQGIFSKKSDVWAYGVVIWEIVTLGALPYTGMKNKDIIERVKKGYRMEKPPHCTHAIYTIMLRCWNSIVNDRPDFTELMYEVRAINRTEEEVVQLSQYDSELYGDIE